MATRFRSIAPVLLFGITPFLSVSPLIAQMAYTAANSESSLTPWKEGIFLADFTEVKFGLMFVRHVVLTPSTPDNSSELNFAIFASGAARKGQSNLLSNFNVAPGFDLGGRIAYVARESGNGRHLAYARIMFSSLHRDVIQQDSTIPDTFYLLDVTQRILAASLGFNVAFSQTSSLGFALEGRREFSATGVEKPREFCTPGTSPLGYRVLVCSDRYVGPLPDLWTAQLRSDFSAGIFPLASGEGAPHLGITLAASANFVESAFADLDFAVGPSIHLPNNPGVPSAVLLFGVNEILEANGPYPDPSGYWTNHLTMRLALGISFSTFTGR